MVFRVYGEDYMLGLAQIGMYLGLKSSVTGQCLEMRAILEIGTDQRDSFF